MYGISHALPSAVWHETMLFFFFTLFLSQKQYDNEDSRVQQMISELRLSRTVRALFNSRSDLFESRGVLATVGASLETS